MNSGASSTTYYDWRLRKRAVKLLPGEWHVATDDVVIVTVLGSCVAACIRDRRTGCGGMNHFMLPGTGDGSVPVSYAARYGVHAMEVIINALIRNGSRREDLEAKVFGGAAVLAGMDSQPVGRRNAEFVLKYLYRERILVAAQDLLGERPRKVYFFPRTGDVRVRYLRELKNDTILRRDLEYRRTLASTRLTGGAELFLS